MKPISTRRTGVTSVIVSFIFLMVGFSLIQYEDSFLRIIGYIGLLWGFSGLIYGFAVLADLYLK